MSVYYFNPQEMITKIIIFDERPVASVVPSFHVAYGIDKNFSFDCGVPIASVLLHNNDVSFVFHVSIDGILGVDIQRLAQLAKSYHTCIRIHLIDCEWLKALPTTKDWSIAMYFRFVIADYLIDQQDKVLYLDADIACQGDLKSLIIMDPTNNIAAVVIERDANQWSL